MLVVVPVYPYSIIPIEVQPEESVPGPNRSGRERDRSGTGSPIQAHPMVLRSLGPPRSVQEDPPDFQGCACPPSRGSNWSLRLVLVERLLAILLSLTHHVFLQRSVSDVGVYENREISQLDPLEEGQ